MKRANQRNRLVTVERLTDVPDGQGGQVRSWASIGQAYVQATPVGGVEAVVAGTLHAQQPWRIEMPWRAGLTSQDRITATWLPDGYAIGIDSINDIDGRKMTLVVFGTASAV